MQIITLRTLVKNGWNIANRRGLNQLIGKDEFIKLGEEFKKLNTKSHDTVINRGDLLIPTGDISLLRNDGDFILKLPTELHDIYVKNYYQRFVNKDINVKNITQKIKEYQSKIINYFDNAKELPESALQSKTMQKLYTPAFKPTSRINEDGYHVTTLIDKSTGKPVEAYVKCINRRNQINHHETSYKVDFENWGIFIKNSKGEYEMVGKRSFYIDKEKGKLLSNWMDAMEGFEQYKGIGLRAHQIGVERMLQENLKTVEICAEGEAFPFHYKSGFRVVPMELDIPKERIAQMLDSWAKESGISKEVLEKNIVTKTVAGKTLLDSQTIENWHKLLYLKNNGKVMYSDTPMELHGEWLERWIQMAKSQPILLD